MNRNTYSILSKLLHWFTPLSFSPPKKTHLPRIAISLLLVVSLLLPSIIPPSVVFAATNYTYDANGNMTSDGTNCFAYNEANQLSQVKNCSTNQVIESYVYDYQGNRFTKKSYTNGTLQKTTYTPDKAVETVKLANGTTQNTTYYYANGELVARKNPDSTKTFYLTDNLHSTSALVDQSGALVEKTAYYPYGDIRSGGTASKYLFTGKEKDAATGLSYYDARYYNSTIRHFTQPDTLFPNIYDPQQLNRYSYARNNPLTYTDPSGHEAIAASTLFLGVGFMSLMMLPILLNPNYRAATAKAITSLSGLVWKADVKAAKTVASAVNNIQLNLNQKNNSKDNKKNPNPNGQKGGPAHQAEVKNIVNEAPEGSNINTEYNIRPEEPFESGKVRRQVDVVEYDISGKPKAFYQVGRTTQGGMPVAREMQAIEDIKSVYPDVPVLFKSYMNPLLEALQF